MEQMNSDSSRNKFTDVMAEKDDIELIRITTSERNDYQPEAVLAAKEELRKRNISATMYQDFTAKVEMLIEVEKNIEKTKSELPLSTWIKVVAFIFPFILFFIIGIGLMAFGYQKRGKDLCKWTAFGLIFYIIIIAIIQML